VMRVRRIDPSDSGDVQRFVNLPFELYRGCKEWVPPLVSEMYALFDRSTHPFYRHSEAGFFVAEEGGQTVGRIAVLENRNYNAHNGYHAALFYYFDCVEDAAVASSLFDAAFSWAQERGLNQVIGPRGFVGTDGLGLLVEGFEHRPAMGIPYNFSYYAGLLSDKGFVKRGDLLSGYLSGREELPERYYALAEKVKTRRGLRIHAFSSKGEMRQWLKRGAAVLNEAFDGSADFYPITDEEFQVAAEQMLTLINPRLIKLVMKDEKIIGFLFAFPDVSAALQRCRGRLWPLGWFYILRELRRTKWVNMNGLGLLPEYRGVGGNVLLYTEMTKTVKEFGFEHVDVVQVGEENTKSLAENEALGVRWYKRHRVFERALEPKVY
jgi:hypothetical protein